MDGPPSTSLTFYPAYCYAASPTYFKWVKLTALDIHERLLSRPGFQGQNLYFYLNHPIQFVNLAGVVVSCEEWQEKRWILVVDDGSGATIEVTCLKPQRKGAEGEEVGVERKVLEEGEWVEEKWAREEIIASLEVGSVIKVKGKIGAFRDVRQIQLERIAVVHHTNAEMLFWEQRTLVKAEILSKPWILSSGKQSRLLRAAEGRNMNERGQELKRKKVEAALQARERKDAERIARRYQREEAKRREGAEMARKAGELLKNKRGRKRTISRSR